MPTDLLSEIPLIAESVESIKEARNQLKMSNSNPGTDKQLEVIGKSHSPDVSKSIQMANTGY
jgi:hypothetical protein